MHLTVKLDKQETKYNIKLSFKSKKWLFICFGSWIHLQDSQFHTNLPDWARTLNVELSVNLSLGACSVKYYVVLQMCHGGVVNGVIKFEIWMFSHSACRWAVSSVMTRQNQVPTEDGGKMTFALIPLWDMCNHCNGLVSSLCITIKPCLGVLD